MTARAFTLIEVLVSLVIFAMAAIVLATSYVNVLSSYQAAGRRQRSEEDWKLVRATVLAEPDREKVEEGGTLPLPGPRLARWSATIEETQVADLFALTIRGHVEQGPSEDAWEREAAVLVLRPTWSEPGRRQELRAASKARIEEARTP